MVETAIVLALFLMLVLGVVDFGRGIAAYSAISHAAREGARAAIYYDTSYDADINAAVANHTAALGADQALAVVTITPTSASTRAVGTLVTVQVDYTFQAVSPLIGQFFPSGVPLRASAQTRVQ
jgi:Flp pilus assembly protein TadG